MSIIFLILAGVFMLLTLISMGFGVASMVKDEAFRKKHAVNLMKLRVYFQASALICLVLAFAVSG